MPFRHILVATDFSEPARNAAQLAARLAAPDTRLTFAHVAAAPALVVPRPLGYGGMAFTLPETQQEMEGAVRALARDVGAPEAAVRILSGPVAPVLAREAHGSGADLIVMGARGMTAMERVLLGSTARAVMRAAPAPVLAVRGALPPEGEPLFRRVAVATDFSDPSREAARLAASIADAEAAELVVAHVVDQSVVGLAFADRDPEGEVMRTARAEAWEKLEEFNRDVLGGRARPLIVAGDPAHEVISLVEREAVDLLAVGTHGPGVVERFLLGSVAERLVERAACSVVVSPKAGA